MFKNACRTCSTSILILLTNNITAFWRRRCPSRRRFLNSLKFSNDDGNGNENVLVKCELALLSSLRDYSKHFNVTKVWQTLANETSMIDAQFRRKNENLS